MPKAKVQTQDEQTGKDQAVSQLESIKEMVKALEAGDEVVRNGGSDKERAEAEQAIHEDALSVQIRSDWHEPGVSVKDSLSGEYNILLCTGGPAVRIIGTLGKYEPDSARLEYQHWGTPWTELRVSKQDEEILLEYARCFYFGE